MFASFLCCQLSVQLGKSFIVGVTRVCRHKTHHFINRRWPYCWGSFRFWASLMIDELTSQTTLQRSPCLQRCHWAATVDRVQSAWLLASSLLRCHQTRSASPLEKQNDEFVTKSKLALSCIQLEHRRRGLIWTVSPTPSSSRQDTASAASSSRFTTSAKLLPRRRHARKSPRWKQASPACKYQSEGSIRRHVLLHLGHRHRNHALPSQIQIKALQEKQLPTLAYFHTWSLNFQLFS